jgi:hypothetical protein
MALTPQEANEREEFFVAESRRRSQVWVLRLDGGFANWREDGSTTVPVWACRTKAGVCATGDFQAYEPEALSLTEFEDVLRLLADRDIWVAVHPDGDLAGNRLPASRLAAILCDDGA